jgi:hypothetical protein
MRPERLPRPSLESLEPSLWIDEAIWGHRLYDEEVPWLALLEMLGVLRAEAEAGRAFKEPLGPNTLRHQSRHLLYLRNIVFNNPRLATILLQVPDDAARWDAWKTAMRETTSGIRDPQYQYVSTRFNSFEDFALLVQLLRSTAIEGDSNKRWTSKFVFPYGPNCLYEDLRLDESGASNDRRFFARVGELLYLMLCRSGRGAELDSLLRPLLLASDARWNRLVGVLEPPGGSERQRDSSSSPYLPYASLDDYRDLADDWLALLRTGLPGYDVLPHLVDILGLHLILYFLRRASEWSPHPEPVRLVVEIVAPKRSTVRDLAADSFQKNALLSKQAVATFIEEEVSCSSDWLGACRSTDPFGQALAVAYQKVGWRALRRGGEEYDGPRTPEGLLEGLRTAAEKRHGQHLASFHSTYARAIGLASRRGARRTRYAPNDQLLKSLVLTLVPTFMEFQQFLHLLWTRYGLIIGHRQAGAFIGLDSDQRAFEENARRLEMRLSSLGLLRRLSDACAYVENPFGGRR